MRTMKRLHQIIVTVALTVTVGTQLGHAETDKSSFFHFDMKKAFEMQRISEDERLARTFNKHDIWPMPVNFNDPVSKKKVDKKELDCLAHNIYYEAGHESIEGKVAVGLVTLNRLADDDFPKNICAVVYQRSNGTCQFSWNCLKLKKPNYKSTAWRESQRIAKSLLEGNDEFDIYKIKYASVMYFHHKSVRSGWERKMTRVKAPGQNIFYRGKL